MESLYVKIRQWFQPYWKPKPKQNKPSKEKPKKITKKKDNTNKESWWKKLFSSDKKENNKSKPPKNNKNKKENLPSVNLENEEESTLYDSYVSSDKFIYDKKLFFRVDKTFIDFMEEMEKQRIIYSSDRDMFIEIDGTDDDFMKVAVEAEYDDSVDLVDFKKHTISRIGEQMLMAVYDKDTPLYPIKELSQLPKLDTIWYYHDRTTHQVLAHLKKGTGSRSTNRSDQLRRKLSPLVYPRNIGEYDRTHLIPFGYHGSEGDSRLLIGWESQQNRVLFRNFEIKQKNLPFDIYWLTKIDKLPDGTGAKWSFEIYDTNFNLVDKLESEVIALFSWASYAG